MGFLIIGDREDQKRCTDGIIVECRERNIWGDGLNLEVYNRNDKVTK